MLLHVWDWSILFGSVPPSLALLYFCVRITRDYGLRRRLFDATADLPPDELHAQFRRAMWIVGLYAAKPVWPVLPQRVAENALVLATVLREHIHHHAGAPLPSSYLSQRRLLIREAKAYARLHASPK
ncbi:MAG: hypothetical protein ABJN34_07270 [Litoreibacter sp.]|uniref:hypothetical protein n=1 Tax=Litoreibacter sp. TaxID=1969459 RepID=UPI003296EA46